jgi:hypothetical protein
VSLSWQRDVDREVESSTFSVLVIFVFLFCWLVGEDDHRTQTRIRIHSAHSNSDFVAFIHLFTAHVVIPFRRIVFPSPYSSFTS